MEISGNTAFYAGLSTIQSGQNRVDQAASQIANTTVERSVKSQSSDVQVERLLSVDRSQQDLSSTLVDMSQGKLQVELGAKVEKAADRALGTLIDTYA
ncbi:pyrroloquinoline quinone biosynthesis protein PqqE [Pseudomonas gingeri]|uniref:Pyrroloquinoline quinone biosynthesis protein PqqE n=1 Tax=Pseudomonas gingeri TaxID=117681 RepID=A0A7Y7YGE9_9PSED|nr:pyrroloquinoline quinone biosynthesis protein PqqE [Pseudomonas gingeri]NWA01973.1 pyrroloquinoline quinone biosynthesis protein PqqE [Pseudomonas gingeri]NWA17981.1 pyrroloquinoline quinone biosynthesis protein PqqE [Pseudomonas gingeri]NWA53364.1 pyrroloquinoline quinone biosynthesis protein PqqE [Pseudomonas gingeri]NWA95323.1 pyrroloquinoline quinone biosynthesis protein PqqE [Pseudomonas gingeri]NWB00229.1 pyrroloquinoline quinone biosynthesis protein PqqE [Pseudomonas gingeri]